jgi:L-lysine 6-transaminase
MSTGIFIRPEEVQDSLKKFMLVDGFDMTLDLTDSIGSFLYDSKHKKKLLDFFTFVASSPLGMNHPKLNNEEFINLIGKIAISKPSLSDIYVKEQAEFVETFFKIAVPSYFKYAFFIEGGTMAVENTLKAAFDWKVRKNFEKGYKEEKGSKIIHFHQSFHGRSGYSLSLTNTDPVKINYFPKFKWPRILNPKVTFPLNEENLAEVIKSENIAIEQIKQALIDYKDDIAGLIIEIIQGEGGDNHFRKEFFLKLREICDENDVLFIADEVQTGIGLTGKWWAHQHFVQPDIISFGKKTQVCGILATKRLDEVEENVFRKPSRINSTWGGNIVDMFRFKRILEIIEQDDLVKNAEVTGVHLQTRIQELFIKYPDKVFNPRGLGLFCAFDTKDSDMRNSISQLAMKNGLLILGCGEKTIRFRPTLCVTKDEIDMGIDILDKIIKDV